MSSSTQPLDVGDKFQIYLYYVFLILGGHICIPISLVTMYITKANVRRYPTLINTLFSWFVYTIPTVFLLYAGQHLSRHPSFNLCLAQAALCYGTSAEAPIATLTLILQLWLEFRGNILGKRSRASCVTLLCVPWLTFLPFVIAVTAVGLKNPPSVNNNYLFYCVIDSKTITYSLAAVIIFSFLGMLVLMLLVLRVFYHNGRVAGVSSVDDRFTLQIPMRIVVFNAYCIGIFVIFCISIANPTLMFPYVLMSTLPFAAFVVLGLPVQYLYLWFGWCLPRRKWKTRIETIVFNQGPGATTTFGATFATSDLSTTLRGYDNDTQKTGPTLVGKPQEVTESGQLVKELRRQDSQNSILGDRSKQVADPEIQEIT